MAHQTRSVRRVAARRSLAALAAVVTFGLLTACTPGGEPTSPGASGSASTTSTTTTSAAKTLTVGASLEPQTLDPTKLAYVAAAQVELFNVYETLVKIDGDGRLQPLLAQRWELSPDRLTYTFFLNPAAKFASGKQVTADAVVKNIDRLRTATADAVNSKYSTWMKVVSGATAVDPTTVKVVLSRPSNTWLYAMGDTTGIIADPDGFADLATKSAGSGPYQVKEWRKGDSIVLERNPGYWGTQPRFDTVTFKYFTDPNAMNTAMLAGTLDIISNEQAPDALAQFADPAAFPVLDGGTNGEVTLALNNSSAALKNVKVRQAIAMAIDKKKILDDVEAGHGVVLGTMDVPTDPYYEDLSAVNSYDPEKAKALLKEAGVASLTLRLRPLAVPYATAAATDVAAMLKAVGINVTVSVEQPGTWIDSVFLKADYDLSIVSHAEARDLNTYTNPQYYWRYTSAAFNAAWLAADSASPEEYPEAMKKAARILADDAASVWLYMMPNLVVSKATVTGLPKNQTTDSFDVTTITNR